MDDDAMFDIDTGRDEIRNATQEDIICAERLGSDFKAQRFGRWKVGFDAWPFGYFYPDYCLGACTIISRQMINIIGHEAEMTDSGHFTMEDVLFAGIFKNRSVESQLL